MPESQSTIYRRRLRMVDHAIYNAIADLFPYYGLLIRADPVLGAVCERLILDWEESRRRLQFIYKAAWQADHEQFDTIGTAADLIAKSRTFGPTGGILCRDYSQHWEDLVRESYRLLEKRAEAYDKPLAWPPGKPET